MKFAVGLQIFKKKKLPHFACKINIVEFNKVQSILKLN